MLRMLLLAVLITSITPFSLQADQAAHLPIDHLITQLADPDFQIRDRASRALVERGPRALSAIEQAARSERPEVALRAMQILTAWATSTDLRAATGAESALRAMAQSRNAKLARRGKGLLARIETMTSQQARLALREAGIEWKSDATGDVQRIRLTGKQLSDDVLVHLSRFKTDQKLIVHVEGAGEKEVRRLQAMLPRVPVISEESGYLGIAMAASKNRCVVSHALPDTPAEQAGLKTADIITSVNRQQIGNNQDLLYLISRLKPGEKIQLDINRNGRPRQVEVVLGRRTLR